MLSLKMKGFETAMVTIQLRTYRSMGAFWRPKNLVPQSALLLSLFLGLSIHCAWLEIEKIPPFG